MATKIKGADLIGKTIVVGDNQATIVIKSVDGDKLSGEFTKDGKTTPMSFPVSQLQGMTEKGLWRIDNGELKIDNSATVVTTDADVQEVQDIVPVVTPRKPESKEDKPTAKVEPIKATVKPEPKPKAKTVPQKGQKYSVVLLPTKDGKQWPKLYGFATEDEAKKIAAKMSQTVKVSWDRDEQGGKRWFIGGGKKYCEVFQQLADALNIGEKAVIDKVCKASVAIFEGARAEGKKKSDCNATLRPKVREGRGKTEDVHQPSSVSSQTSTEKTYTAAEVMDLIQRMAKKDPKALAEYEAMLQAA